MLSMAGKAVRTNQDVQNMLRDGLMGASATELYELTNHPAFNNFVGPACRDAINVLIQTGVSKEDACKLFLAAGAFFTSLASQDDGGCDCESCRESRTGRL